MQGKVIAGFQDRREKKKININAQEAKNVINLLRNQSVDTYSRAGCELSKTPTGYNIVCVCFLKVEIQFFIPSAISL